MTEHDSSFRTRQVVADLVHHAGPLAKLHFTDLVRASGLTPWATGDALALLRDDGFCFRRDETLALMDGLAALAIAGEQGFDLATVILLADLLQMRRGLPWLADVWTEAARRLTHWPATLRAAVANGLALARELGLLELGTVPTAAERLTRQPDEIAEALLQIARSMRPDELFAVAEADDGLEVDQHWAALRQVIGLRDGLLLPQDNPYPSKVIELTANEPGVPGHPGCTAILLLNALLQGDQMQMVQRWELQAAAYCELKPSQLDPILAAFRFLYETGTAFPNSATLTIPVVAEV